MKPGQAERRDYEYEGNDAANLFMMFAPLEGSRRVDITDRRIASDYAGSGCSVRSASISRLRDWAD